MNAHACVIYVYNVTSALYCAINNHFCVIRVSFVATSQHVVECAIHHKPGVHEDLHPHACGVNMRRLKSIYMRFGRILSSGGH